MRRGTSLHALGRGKFKVEGPVPERECSKETTTREGDGRGKQDDEVAVIEVRVVEAKEEGGADLIDIAVGTHCVEAERSNGNSSDDETDHKGSSTSSTSDTARSEDTATEEIAEPEDDTATEAIVEPEKVLIAVDPFEDLVTELKRGYVLKAAFE
ncbi:hypothetical protein OPT61_g9244 [Boeremia exigua]|uniref:Uncharacterized protein n=1 Tax=Boeremia exigua TaxID=749465 RepID=A0ACC2HV95_9PLEO|nr:hypothetical protein OPT61_g9244 [Boeremia exigua]